MNEKGTYGYLDHKRKTGMIKILVNLVLVIAVFAVGILLTRTRDSYFTVAAVLLVIPLAYFITGLAAVWPFHSLSPERMRQFDSVTGSKNAVTAYDLVLTVNQKLLYAGAVFFSSREVVLFTEGKMNLQEKRNELSGLLKSTGYFTGVYLTDNWDNFLSRVKADLNTEEITAQNDAESYQKQLDELHKQKERLLIYSV